MHTFGLHKDVTCQAEIFIFFLPTRRYASARYIL